jgi:MFS family permease
VLGGLIVEHLSWQWLFWLPLIPIALAAGLTARFIPESPIRVPGRINWLSAALMAVGVTTVLVAVTEATTWGWSSVKTVALFAGGLALCGAWIVAELHASEPLVDMAMMRIKGVWTTNLAAFLLGAGMYTFFILIPQLAVTPESSGYGFGASIFAAGAFLLPSTVTMLAAGSMAGPLAARYGSKLLLIGGGILSAAAFAVLTFAHAASWEIHLASALLGAGIGLAYAALGTLIIQAVPPEQTGVATAMNTLMRSVGGAVGSQIAATLVAGQVLASGLPAERGYVLAFATSLGFLIVCVLASLAIPTPTRRPAPAVAAEEA